MSGREGIILNLAMALIVEVIHIQNAHITILAVIPNTSSIFLNLYTLVLFVDVHILQF